MHRSACNRSGNVFKSLATVALDASPTQCANIPRREGSSRHSARYSTAIRHAPSARRWRQLPPVNPVVHVNAYTSSSRQAEFSSAHLLIDAYDGENEMSRDTERASKQTEGLVGDAQDPDNQELRTNRERRPVGPAQWTARLREEEALSALSFDSLSETDFNGFDSSIGETVAQQNIARAHWKTSLLAFEESYRNQVLHRLEEPDTEFVKFGRLSSERIQAVMLKLPEADMPSLPSPWALREDERAAISGASLLSAEIQRFQTHIQPNKLELDVRQDLAYLVRGTVHASMTFMGTLVTGSSSTGLATALSDIDIALNDQEMYNTPRARAALLVILDFMKDKGGRVSDMATDFTLATIRHGKNSIINAQHRATGLDVQITAGASTERQSRTTKYWMREYPFVKPLFMLIRTSLDARGLLDTYTGGLGSWTLLSMMMACVLRQDYVRKLPTLADQLLFVLHYLGTFPFDRRGLSTRGGRLFNKNIDAAEWHEMFRSAHRNKDRDRRAQLQSLSPLHRRRQWLMSLQDLTSPERILGNNTTSIEFIQDTFRYLHLKLRVGMREVDEAKAAGRPWKHESLLEPVVGRIHEIEHRRRARMIEHRVILNEQSNTLRLDYDWHRSGQVKLVIPKPKQPTKDDRAKG